MHHAMQLFVLIELALAFGNAGGLMGQMDWVWEGSSDSQPSYIVISNIKKLVKVNTRGQPC